ncbi:globin family protein [Sneathiella limimaris]|uniref:globin family protein n=1 Tax=Sneathiella limimaris TaxID=1964213 RepID=UPI00146AEF4F|nr:globin family protein [Sneathiella limimaris]
MTPKQIELVQTSFKSVAAISEQAAELFYNRLFELDPSLKPLFKGNMKEQGKKLMATIGVAVSSLKNLEKIRPTVEALGKSHKDYGVQDRHYDTVAEALIWTLGKGLGDAFTEDVKAAWVETYTTLATIMKEAAKPNPAEILAKSLLSEAIYRIPEFEKQRAAN